MTDQAVLNENQSPLNATPKKKKVSKILLAFLIFFGICLILCIAGFVYILFNRLWVETTFLRLQGRCPEAIASLDKVIEKNPKNVKAYELRAICNESMGSNVFSERQGYLLAALEDANTIIKMEPNNGNYYVRRELILRDLAGLEIESVNKFAIYEYANENAEKAIELGVDSSYDYINRHAARYLIESNHCKEGLKETQELIDKADPQDTVSWNYNYVNLTEAYICLGELDKALESAKQITCDDPVATCRSGLLAEIYFQSGDNENALNILNYMINSQPAGGGWRYFIRALINYENGQKDLAMQDLELGDAYSWYGTGVYWYVEAKLAFDVEDRENGILYLKNAEKTLDVQYSPFRERVVKELKSLGEEPFEPIINLPFTPIPIP